MKTNVYLLREVWGTKLMKILMAGKDWFPNTAGGLNRYFYGEIFALSKLGVSGTALVSAVKQGQTSPFQLVTMAPEGASLISRLAGARRAALALAKQDVDVINTHFALYSFPWVNQLPDIPLVVNFQGPYASEMSVERGSLKDRIKSSIAMRMEKTAYKRASTVITLSTAFREIVHTNYNIPLERVRVVPGAVDLYPYLAAPNRKSAREKLDWPQERPILLAVRRLARRMGYEGLIESMSAVRKQHPNVLLFIGGTGTIKEELLHQIEKSDLSNNVRLLGFIPDDQLPLAYAAADFSIVPTIKLEGFGLSTVESLASGTPVLGTSIGGTPEILTGLEPKLLFTAPTPDAISAKISDALSNRIPVPDTQACRDYSIQFGWEAVAPKILQLFNDVIAT